jgi:hypothetical protein
MVVTLTGVGQDSSVGSFDLPAPLTLSIEVLQELHFLTSLVCEVEQSANLPQ